jgi:hypothetical protein
MYLHIGGDYLIPLEEILYIIPLSDSLSQANKEFFKHLSQKNRLLFIETDASSLIGCSDGTVYGSPISSMTLRKRLSNSPGSYKIT